MASSLTQCMHCGSSDLADKIVEKLVRGGNHVAVHKVKATVCHHCGERYFDQKAIAALEKSREKLARVEMDEYRRVGELLLPDAG